MAFHALRRLAWHALDERTDLGEGRRREDRTKLGRRYERASGVVAEEWRWACGAWSCLLAGLSQEAQRRRRRFPKSIVSDRSCIKTLNIPWATWYKR